MEIVCADWLVKFNSDYKRERGGFRASGTLGNNV